MKKKLLISFALGVLFGIPTALGLSLVYYDLDGDEWYAKAAFNLHSKEIMMGINEEFKADELVNRAQLAVTLDRTIEHLEEEMQKQIEQEVERQVNPPTQSSEKFVDVKVVNEFEDEIPFTYFSPEKKDILEITNDYLLVHAQRPAGCHPEYTAYIDTSKANEQELEIKINHNIDLAVTICNSVVENDILMINLSEITQFLPLDDTPPWTFKVNLGGEIRSVIF